MQGQKGECFKYMLRRSPYSGIIIFQLLSDFHLTLRFSNLDNKQLMS